VAWEALLAHTENLKELAVKCMVLRVFIFLRECLLVRKYLALGSGGSDIV
jgi:hypothetical protein